MISGEALHQIHHQGVIMPTCLLAFTKSIYANNEYILGDGCKQVRVRPHLGVGQGCPLSPWLFSLYINNGGWWAENVQGAVTLAGNSEVHITHMLYAHA
eukprot:1142024-Pelagomonas_calceolata.AAC.1